MRKHGFPINMPRGMIDKELADAIAYGAQSSAKIEKTFVRKELVEQLQSGYVAIFPLAAV